jgi:hypothetical protein
MYVFDIHQDVLSLFGHLAMYKRFLLITNIRSCRLFTDAQPCFVHVHLYNAWRTEKMFMVVSTQLKGTPRDILIQLVWILDLRIGPPSP